MLFKGLNKCELFWVNLIINIKYNCVIKIFAIFELNKFKPLYFSLLLNLNT